MSKICFLFSILSLISIPTTFADTIHQSSPESDSQGMRLGLGVFWTASAIATVTGPTGGSVRIRFPSGLSIEPTVGYQQFRSKLGGEPTTEHYFSSETLVRIPIATNKNTELLALVGLRLGMSRANSTEVVNEELTIVDENQASAGLHWGIGMERFFGDDYSLGIRATSGIFTVIADDTLSTVLGPFASPQYQLSATIYF